MYWYQGKLIDSQKIELAIDDWGWLYGANVFTTLRIYQGNLEHPLTLWDLHYQRIYRSLTDLNWQFPNWDHIIKGIHHLMSDYPVLRITIFPDGRELIIGRQLPLDLKQQQKEGICAVTIPHYQRSLPHLKTGNYLAPYLVRQQAIKLGGREGILVNSQGEWLETTTGNLWGYGLGQWWTPPLESGILPGTMRSYILNKLVINNRQVNQVPWEKSIFSQLEIVFYTNAIIHYIPIQKINDGGHNYNYDPHHIALSELWHLIISR